MAYGRVVEGFDYTPTSFYIFVADYGQPQMSKGGIYYGGEHTAYRADQWRYGEVIGIGPGKITRKGIRIPVPDIDLGDVVLFSRRHGTRLGLRYHHPTYKTRDGLLVRVLDPDKTVAIMRGFEPWWDVQEATPVDHEASFTG